MRDKQKAPTEYNEADYTEYKLKPNDALYIQINSLDDAASNVFTQSSIQQTLDPYGAYLNSFSLDNEGFIHLPVIGKISVSGKTTAQISEQIRDSMVNILSHPMITVRLVNRYVSVLGEVGDPGHFVYSQDRFTIFNAIGLAGDITEFGNRKKVMLIRNENGKNIKIRIDLTNSEILSSSYYYIQPNDFIYVSPMRKRIWGMAEFPFVTFFSALSTAIVVYTFVQSQ